MANIAGTDISVISTAFNNMHGEIVDNIFAQVPLFEYLRARDHVMLLDGGERINVPVMHATNSTAKSYSGYDILDTTPQEGIGNVEYLWRQYSVSVAINGREQKQVRGRFAIANLLDAKRMQAEMSIADKLNTDAFAAQTGDNLDGLQTLIADSPSTGTVGGINRATNSWWRNQQTSGASSSSAFDNLLSSMRSIYNSCNIVSKRFGPPDIFVTDQLTFEGYEGLVDSQRQYGNERLLDLGFVNLAFKTAGVIFDGDAPTTRMYALNTNTLKLAMHNDAQLTPTEFVKPSDQDAIVAQILFMGNLITMNAATNGVITGIESS